jgi:hypothetical protein
MSLADYIPPEFIELFSNSNFQKALDGYFTFKIKEDPKYRESINEIVTESYRTPEFKGAIETVIVTSDLEIPLRLRAVEKITGTYNFEDFEEHEPTIPEQITKLKERIESNPQTSVTMTSKNVIPETKSGIRAFFIKQYLETEVKENPQGEKILYGRHIKDLIKRVIPSKHPECAIEKGQNERKVKKDALDILKNVYGDIIVENNPHGRHDTLVRLKPLQTVTS